MLPTSHIQVGRGRVSDAFDVRRHTLVLPLVGFLSVFNLQGTWEKKKKKKKKRSPKKRDVRQREKKRRRRHTIRGLKVTRLSETILFCMFGAASYPHKLLKGLSRLKANFAF